MGGSTVNMLERSAMRRAEKRLTRHMEPGERVLDFDIGSELTTGTARVDCIATTKALYIVTIDGRVARWPYSEMAHVEARGTRLGIQMVTDVMFVVEFGRGARTLGTVVAEQFEAVTRRRRLVHVGWGAGLGATFLVSDGSVISWCYDEGTPDEPTNSTVMEQAFGELRVSLGATAPPGYKEPHPAWMPDLEWTPPLG
jgi:hypothetical protein